MKVLTLPTDIKNFGRTSVITTISKSRIAAEATTIVLALLFMFAFFGVLVLMMDVQQPVGLVAGSLTSLLGGKPNRRKVTPNFRIIADMGLGEKLPSRKQLMGEDEEHMWTKYPSLMLKKVLGGVA